MKIPLAKIAYNGLKQLTKSVKGHLRKYTSENMTKLTWAVCIYSRCQISGFLYVPWPKNLFHFFLLNKVKCNQQSLWLLIFNCFYFITWSKNIESIHSVFCFYVCLREAIEANALGELFSSFNFDIFIRPRYFVEKLCEQAIKTEIIDASLRERCR